MAAFLLGGSAAMATLTMSEGYYGTVYHAHASPGSIGSYDWTSNGDLFYSATTPSYQFGGIYRSNSSGVTEIAGPDTSLYSSVSVVASGDYVYYNASDGDNNQFIYKYGPLGGSSSVSQISDTPNYSLHVSGGSLFITGAYGYGPNHIFYSTLDSSGNLSSNPATDLGQTGTGGSGPLAFDSAGNLYYAPGYGDDNIYRWSNAEVMMAVSGGQLSVAGHEWLDYSSLYSVSGATSMAFNENGLLLVTLTNFSYASALVAFGIDENGAFSGESHQILESDGRLGEIRIHDGELYVADGNTIYHIVPEPSSFAILALSSLLLAAGRRRKA